MHKISDNVAKLQTCIQIVQTRIQKAEQKFARPTGSVQLIAVSKTRPSNAIKSAYACGLSDFAESYLQEALEKMAALKDLAITWHFIGPIQSNKTRAIAENFAWVHSIERIKIADRLNEQRPSALPPLNVCLQVNISGESTKAGILPDQLLATADQIQKLPHLTLRGLMAIPAPCEDFEQQRKVFAVLAEYLRELRRSLPAGQPLDTLSMGMSDDLEAAIAEGATMVRVGTDIFGERH